MSSETNGPNAPEPGDAVDPSPPATPSDPVPPPTPRPQADDPGPAYEADPPRTVAPAGAAGAGVDLAAVPRSVWISLGGGVVLLLSVFFNWYTLTVSIAGRSGSKSESGWDSGAAAKIIALLAVVIIAAWLVELFAEDVTLPFAAWMIAGAAGAVALLLVLFKIVSKPASDQVGQFNSLGFGHASVGTSWGIWLALLSTVAVLAGAYMRMNEQA